MSPQCLYGPKCQGVGAPTAHPWGTVCQALVCVVCPGAQVNSSIRNDILSMQRMVSGGRTVVALNNVAFDFETLDIFSWVTLLILHSCYAIFR